MDLSLFSSMNISQLTLLYDGTRHNVEKQDIVEAITNKIHSFTTVEEWMSAKAFFVTHPELKSLCNVIDRSLGKIYTLYGLILITIQFANSQVWNDACYRIVARLLKRAKKVDAGILTDLKTEYYFYKYIVVEPDYDKVREKLIQLDNTRYDLFIFSLVNTSLDRINLLLDKLPPGHQLLNYLLLRKQNLYPLSLQFKQHEIRMTALHSPAIEFDGLTLTFYLHTWVLRNRENGLRQLGDKITVELEKIINMHGEASYNSELRNYDVAGYLRRYSEVDRYSEVPDPIPVPCREAEWEIFANLYDTVGDEIMKKYTEEEFCEICIDAFQKHGRRPFIGDEELLFQHVSGYIDSCQISTLAIDEILSLKKYSKEIYRAFSSCFVIESISRNDKIKNYLAKRGYIDDLRIFNAAELNSVYAFCQVRAERLDDFIL